MLRHAWPNDPRLVPVWHGRRTRPGAGGLRFDILRETAALYDAVRRVDVVLCLAGATPTPGAALHANRDIALAVQAAAGARPLLLASSAAVYGRAAGACREEAPTRPVTAYGRAKLAMETAVLARGGPVTCLRIGNVAGADQILPQVVAGAPITLDRFPDGRTPARSYIGPGTLAAQLAELCLAAGRGAALPPVLNVTAPGAVEMGALLDAVPCSWTPRTASADAIAQVLLDVERLGRILALDPASGTPQRLVAEWRADLDMAEKDR